MSSENKAWPKLGFLAKAHGQKGRLSVTAIHGALPRLDLHRGGVGGHQNGVVCMVRAQTSLTHPPTHPAFQVELSS